MAEMEWKIADEGRKAGDKAHKHEWGDPTLFQGVPSRFCKDLDCGAWQTGRRIMGERALRPRRGR